MHKDRMTIWNRTELAAGLGARDGLPKIDLANNSGNDFVASGFSIDSRTIQQGDIFLPLQGGARDGHEFIPNVLENGAAASFCHINQWKKYSAMAMTKGKLIASNDIIADLTLLARYRRDQIKSNRGENPTIVGITGSVGKTSTKEMLGVVLASYAERLAKKMKAAAQQLFYISPANQNNTLGVPLCLVNTPATIHYGIYEAGMNHKGELAAIGQTLRPDIGVITNIYENHIGHFADINAIAEAKYELIDSVAAGGTAILNCDSGFFEEHSKKFIKKKKGIVISFGASKEADIYLDLISDVKLVQTKFFDRSVHYKLGALGEHQVINSLAILAALKALNIPIDNSTLSSLATYRNPRGRGDSQRLSFNQRQHGQAGALTLIDDSYNASPTSMMAALRMLTVFNPDLTTARRWAILGDMKELGAQEVMYHQTIIAAVAENNAIANIITVGPAMANAVKHHEKIQKKLLASYKTADEMVQDIAKGRHLKPDDIILVKGSNASRLSLVVAAIKEYFG